tara:strand:+ start:638 stop:1654 length:1017 start_codon:yes stop_codon:yes gene_type:complete
MQTHTESGNAKIDGYIPLDHNQNQAALFRDKNGDQGPDDFVPEVFNWQHSDGQPGSQRYIGIGDGSSTDIILKGDVSPSYAFTPYRKRWDDFDAALEQSNLKTESRLVSFDFTKSGARAFRQTVLPLYTRNIRGTDGIALRFLQWDSVDGSSAAITRCGFYQFVCANTLVTGDDIFCDRQIHRGRPRVGEITKHDERVAELQALENFEKMIDMTQNAVGVFEATADILEELVEVRVEKEAHTLDFLNQQLAAGDLAGRDKSKQRHRLAEHLHANWSEARRNVDNTFFDFANTLTNYAAHGPKDPALDDRRTRVERETWVGAAIEALPNFARSLQRVAA